MVGFPSIHVFSWPEPCEEIAAERIKVASKKRLLGTKFPARETWYHRKCLSRVYFLSPLLLLASGTMLTMKVLPKLHMHDFAASFEKTKCTTASVNLTDLELPCNCKTKKAPDCEKMYHCLQFSVRFKTKKGIKITTDLYEDMEALQLKYQKCAVLNRECKKHEPEAIVMSLVEHYGEEGSSFQCMYNPHEESEVILHVKPLKISFWAFMAFICICLALSVLAPVIAYFTCGTMYVCTKSPPADIVAEAERRAVEGPPPAPADEAAAPLSPTETAAEPAPVLGEGPPASGGPPATDYPMFQQPQPQHHTGGTPLLGGGGQAGMYAMPPPYQPTTQSLQRPVSGVPPGVGGGGMPYPMIFMPGTPVPMVASNNRGLPADQLSNSSSPGPGDGPDGTTYLPPGDPSPYGAQYQPLQPAPFMYMAPGTVIPGYYPPFMGYGMPPPAQQQQQQQQQPSQSQPPRGEQSGPDSIPSIELSTPDLPTSTVNGNTYLPTSSANGNT